MMNFRKYSLKVSFIVAWNDESVSHNLKGMMQNL